MTDENTCAGAQHHRIPNIPLINCFPTRLEFDEANFCVIYCQSQIQISSGPENKAIITLKNQQVPYKATILGGLLSKEEITGHMDYKKYFNVDWQDDVSMPEIQFYKKPSKIIRQYEEGQHIELGTENVCRYEIFYPDGVTADFTRTKRNKYEFSFSTGFTGSVRKDDDGSHFIHFKAIPLDDEDHRSESKFVITRSRYTNNLLLLLKDKATVIADLEP